MAVDSFKDVTWNSDDAVTADKLNLMSQNSRYLLERQAKLTYNAYGIQKDSGLKIAAGIITAPRNTSDSQLVNVYFGSFFTPGCQPVISLGCHSPVQGRIMLTFMGLGGHTAVPDHRGFICRLGLADKNPATQFFIQSVYVHWIAVGY